MPKQYSTEAIKLCRQYYCEFGGNAEQVEKAMRRDYPNWSRQLLIDKQGRLGWTNKYGFDKSLEVHQQTQINSVESDDERRYRAVVELADRYQEIALQGGEAGEKAVDKFIKLTQQQIELRSKLDLSTANFETFAADFDLIVSWAKEIDVELAKLFYRRKDKFIERAEQHFGKNA